MGLHLKEGADDDLAENHEINVTPFIDVMLVLLIIFMVAAPLATVDVPVDLPVSTAERQPKPDTPLYLTLKEDLSFTLKDTPVSREALAKARAFYDGPIADRIEGYFKRIGGWMTRADLAPHRTEWVEPIRTDYRGVEVYGLGPNTQGLSTHQILNICEQFDLKGMGFQSAASLHVQAEAKRLAARDLADELERIVTLHDIEISRAGRASSLVASSVSSTSSQASCSAPSGSRCSIIRSKSRRISRARSPAVFARHFGSAVYRRSNGLEHFQCEAK